MQNQCSPPHPALCAKKSTSSPQAVTDQLRERGKLSANQGRLNGIQPLKDRLTARLSDAERTNIWDSIKTELYMDWNSLVTDVEHLELQLYE